MGMGVGERGKRYKREEDGEGTPNEWGVAVDPGKGHKRVEDGSGIVKGVGVGGRHRKTL